MPNFGNNSMSLEKRLTKYSEGHAVEYYVPRKKKEIGLFVLTWKDAADILFSE